MGVIVVMTGGARAWPPSMHPRSAALETRQQTQSVQWLARLREWLDAVERHEAGTADAPAVTVSSWSRSELQELLIDIRTLLELLRHPDRPASKRPGRTRSDLHHLRELANEHARRGDPNRVVKRGALLHADIPMLVHAESSRLPNPTPSQGPGIVLLTLDGRNEGFEHADVHWGIGRTLLDAVAPDPSRDEMVRLWYRATAAHLQRLYLLGELRPHLERARRLFPMDADILISSGALHETFAAPRVQVVIQSVAVPLGFKPYIASAREELRRAETFFRQALEVNPALTQARVRLARVIGLLGRHEEAAGHLRQAVTAIEDSLLLYYAQLFLGHEEEALGRRDAARARFERAAALYPRAQSPRLALSHLARRFGDRSGALHAIQHVLTLPADESEREDPWWEYHVAHVRDAEALLAELRRPFLAAEQR